VSKENTKPPRSPATAGHKPAPPAAPPAAPPSARGPTGRVRFDDRGNAIWEWSVATGSFGRDVSTSRLKKLDHPALSIADDSPTPVEAARRNPLGAVRGYDPYDSGQLDKKKAPPRKKDLRRLGEWIKLRKQAEGQKDDE